MFTDEFLSSQFLKLRVILPSIYDARFALADEFRPALDQPNLGGFSFDSITLSRGTGPVATGTYVGDTRSVGGQETSFSIGFAGGNRRVCMDAVKSMSLLGKHDYPLTQDTATLLLAHELGHGYRHSRGYSGYNNENWARTLELSFVEALCSPSLRGLLGVSLPAIYETCAVRASSLYKGCANERLYYTKITGKTL